MEMEGRTVERSDSFSTETTGLPQAARPMDIRLKDGDRFDLRIGSVRKRLGDGEIRMLAYNGSIPGPSLYVDQDSSVTVDVTNDGDVDATVHWHGLRLENRYDGVPEETQSPIEVGGTYTCRVHFPDAGFYWYHPHIREDYAQEMGLSGTIVVRPTDPSYWPPADREVTITLDDVLIEDGKMAPFSRSGPTFTAMGRFGNVMLINGDTEFSDKVAAGEVVRLNLVNTANTRIFNVGLSGTRMKLIGGDSGRYERELFVDEVMLSPSERTIVDVLFESEGTVRLEHRTPEHVYDLGSFVVEGKVESPAAAAFTELRLDPSLTEERRSIGSDFDREPDKTLSFTSEMPLLYGDGGAVATSYVCPMHPEVTDTEASTCPKCGMKLIPAASDASTTSHEHDHGHTDTGDGLEWEDLMPDINRQTDLSNMIWKLVDKDTGAVNHEIAWSFKLDERVKIRLVNEMEGSEHPMHHPFHVHGAGRFLILSRDGVPEANLVWKDTVLLRAGETVDVLLHLTNPGLWMAHCHIAEHTESGMMFSFRVEP